MEEQNSKKLHLHLKLWNCAIVPAVTINVMRKIISFCLLWAAMEYGGLRKLTHTVCSESSILRQDPYWALPGKSCSKISTHCKPIQGYFFFALAAPPILQVSRGVIMCLLVCTVMLCAIWGQQFCLFFILLTSMSSKWKEWFNIFWEPKRT